MSALFLGQICPLKNSGKDRRSGMKKVTELVAELAAPAVAEQGCTLWDVE